MKYKLLKDLPWHSAGEILETDDTGKLIVRTIPGMLYPESFPKLFEPVIERWSPEIDSVYWFVTTNLVATTDRFHSVHICESHTKRFDSGNCFKTADQATEAAKRIKQTLMDYHKDLNS